MEWKKVKLGEVCDRVCSGGTPNSRNSKYYDGGIPWLNTKEIDFGRIYSTERTISQEGLENSSAKWIDENSVIVAMYGATAGKVAVSKIRLTTNQACCNLHIDEKKADYNFVYYYLLDNFSILASLANGGAQQNLNAQIIKDFLISLPPLETQSRIAAILSSLDDKIENNNRINSNLEAQAQALFKSWFVDFEPWGGIMPDDWKEGVYNDIIEKTISGDWGKERPEGNYDHSVACIRGCDFEDINNGIRGKTPQRYILEKNYQNKGLKNRDIVVEISGGTATVSTGRVCLITEKLLQKYDYDIVCTNFCRTIRPLADYYTYLYYSWKYKYDQRIMFGYENGTSGIKNFAIKDFIEKEPLIIPSCDVVKSFNKVISVLHDKSQENGTESSRLAALRDSMLPKLMKGEIEL